MHPAKTKYSIISTRQKIGNSAKQPLDLSVDGMQLTKVESERVLGVYIDSHLTQNEHIDILRRKLLQRIAILARARKYIPTKYRLLSTVQVSNRSLLIAVLVGATVAKPTQTSCLNFRNAALDQFWIVLGMYDLMIIFKILSGNRLINYSSSIDSAFK